MHSGLTWEILLLKVLTSLINKYCASLWVKGKFSPTDFVPLPRHCAWPACSGHLWPPPPEAALVVEADGLSYSHYYEQRISLARQVLPVAPTYIVL